MNTRFLFARWLRLGVLSVNMEQLGNCVTRTGYRCTNLVLSDTTWGVRSWYLWPGKRPSRWPGAWQTAISLAGCLANGHLASPPWPNAWQTAISRGARIRERSPPREAVLTPPICAMAQCPANGHLVRAPPLRRPPRTLALGRLWGAGNAVLGRKNGNRPLCPKCGVSTLRGS